MGVVYKARQQVGGGERVVALKVIQAGRLASPEAVERFLQEARAAATLDHPGIVPIHDIGEADGQHYFTMQLMTGGSLAERVGEGPLPPEVAARVVRRVAEAVQHAHERGIIHRDLKPANILLGGPPRGAAAGTTGTGGQAEPTGLASTPGSRSEADGVVAKVTDFGLARMRESGLSVTGEAMGTPSYMPREQARGQLKASGPASDVYGLGAVLYCLLTGRPPFQAADPLETMRQVCDEEPVPPRQVNSGVPHDLETVCLKCLHKEPARRYASAAELAEELARFERGEPVRARPVGRLERTWRWSKRNPVVASLLSVVLLLLLLGTSVGWLLAVRAEAERARDNERAALAEKERADRETKEALRQKGEAEKAREKAKKAEADAKKAEANAIREARLARQGAYDSGMLLTQAAWEQHQVDRFLQLLEEHRPRKVGNEDFRGFEWFYWKRQFQRGHLTLKGHTAEVRSVAFSADSKRLASGSSDGTVKVWEAVLAEERSKP